MIAPRVLLVTGSSTWTDRARVAAELAPYQPGAWHMMHGACHRDGDALADEVALSMGFRADVDLHRRPADWSEYQRTGGKRGSDAGTIRNSAMAEEAARGVAERRWSAVQGLAFGSLERADGAMSHGHRQASGTGHMVALMRELGWRVRWVLAPEVEARTLAVHVYTVCLKRPGIWDEPDLLDITRGTGGPRGEPFAPSWGLLRPALAKLRQGGVVAEEGWAEYAPAFVDEMRRSYRANPEAWAAFLARERIVLGCYCHDRARCHRGLLAGIAVSLGGVDCGELPPGSGGQLALHGLGETS